MRLIRRFTIRNIIDVCGVIQHGFSPERDYPILGYVEEDGIDMFLVANDWDELEWVTLDRCQFGALLD